MLISLDPEQLIRISAVPIAHDPNSQDLRLAEPNLGVLATRRDSDKLEPAQSSAGDRYALYLGPSSEHYLAEAEAQINEPLSLPLCLQYCDIGGYQWPRVTGSRAR